jgi:hypothetical protein
MDYTKGKEERDGIRKSKTGANKKSVRSRVQSVFTTVTYAQRRHALSIVFPPALQVAVPLPLAGWLVAREQLRGWLVHEFILLCQPP